MKSATLQRKSSNRKSPGKKLAVKQVIVPASFVALLLTCLYLDKVVFPFLEDERLFEGQAWSDDEKKLFKLSCLRNEASRDWPLFKNQLIRPRQNSTGARILVLGDSFVWGDGYRNVNDLWWRQLSRELSRRGYENVEVLAAGYPGFTTALETKTARPLIEKLHPDLIIWGYTENDADEGVIKQSIDKSPRRVAGSVRRLLPNLSLYVDKLLTQKSGAAAERAQQQRWELNLLKGENFNRFSDTVDEMKLLLSDSRIPGIVVSLPTSPDEQYNKARFEPVKPLFERTGIPFLDLSQSLNQWYSFVLPRVIAARPLSIIRPYAFLQASPANAHPSAALSSLYAAKASDFLEARFSYILKKSKSAGGTVPARKTVKINDCLPIFASGVESGNGRDFEYPDSSLLLSMPGRTPAVQFNLETPVHLSRICLQGENLHDAMIFVSTVDSSLGFDAGEHVSLGGKAGRQLEWDAASIKDPINTISIHANFDSEKNSNRRLILELDP